MNKKSSLKLAIAATAFAFAANGVGAATAQRVPISEQVNQTKGAASAVVSGAAASYFVVP
jgi:hypothetical protein